MKKFLPALLLIAGSGFSFDLSDLHAGSALSGTIALLNPPMVEDTASVLLPFSDPSDDCSVTFDDLTFLNTCGNLFTKKVNLMPSGLARCAAFPCPAKGGFEDNSPTAFRALYSVTATPEPDYGQLLVPALLVGIVILRRIIRVG